MESSELSLLIEEHLGPSFSQNTQERFAANMDEEMVRKMARSVYGRSKLCIEQGGGHFEHLKSKASRKLN